MLQVYFTLLTLVYLSRSHSVRRSPIQFDNPLMSPRGFVPEIGYEVRVRITISLTMRLEQFDYRKTNPNNTIQYF